MIASRSWKRGQIKVWLGTYSDFAVNKQMAMLRQEQLYKAQQKRIVQIETAIKRFELWASIVVDERHARQARARYKMLDRMDKIERPSEQGRMKLELGGWRGSNKVLEIGRLVKWFEDAQTGDPNIVLDGVDPDHLARGARGAGRPGRYFLRSILRLRGHEPIRFGVHTRRLQFFLRLLRWDRFRARLNLCFSVCFGRRHGFEPVRDILSKGRLRREGRLFFQLLFSNRLSIGCGLEPFWNAILAYSQSQGIFFKLRVGFLRKLLRSHGLEPIGNVSPGDLFFWRRSS